MNDNKKEKYGVNTIHKTRNGGYIRIIGPSVKDSKKRDVMFLDTNTIKRNVCMSAILRGSVLNPSVHERFYYEKGDTFDTKYNQGEIVVIVKHRNYTADVKFLNTNQVVKNVSDTSIQNGSIIDTSLDASQFNNINSIKYKLGETFHTDFYGDIKIIRVDGCKRNTRDIKFLNTGFIKKNVYTSNIRNGKIRDTTVEFVRSKPSKFITKYLLNEKYKTKSYGYIKIIRVDGCKRNTRDVQFINTGFIKKNVHISSINTGYVRDTSISE